VGAASTVCSDVSATVLGVAAATICLLGVASMGVGATAGAARHGGGGFSFVGMREVGRGMCGITPISSRQRPSSKYSCCCPHSWRAAAGTGFGVLLKVTSLSRNCWKTWSARQLSQMSKWGLPQKRFTNV
jgi:hypothetical protein